MIWRFADLYINFMVNTNCQIFLRCTAKRKPNCRRQPSFQSQKFGLSHIGEKPYHPSSKRLSKKRFARLLYRFCGTA
jgi:hypothetical protein